MSSHFIHLTMRNSRRIKIIRLLLFVLKWRARHCVSYSPGENQRAWKRCHVTCTRKIEAVPLSELTSPLLYSLSLQRYSYGFYFQKCLRHNEIAARMRYTGIESPGKGNPSFFRTPPSWKRGRLKRLVSLFAREMSSFSSLFNRFKSRPRENKTKI